MELFDVDFNAGAISPTCSDRAWHQSGQPISLKVVVLSQDMCSTTLAGLIVPAGEPQPARVIQLV